MTEVTTKQQADAALDTTPITPAEECPLPSTDTPDAPPLLRGQRRPKPIGPPIPNHPLAPLMGAFNDEPLWDEWQEAIRAYRQRCNEQPDEDL